ncbi:PA-phosphatase [Algoriphagus kandeliae]|uniref:PA-phosphatase n=2 Tax=Algoriphagus kandeliae TaxID=2562278 RepID=A0A4Y9QN19_9BACT|nr:PA-phosphatase [Algoriphagus kandeliae]
MGKISSLVISVVFQPLIIPMMVFGMILFGVPESTSVPFEFKTRIFYLILMSTLVIPMLTIFGLRLSGTVKSLHMHTTKDRIIPFSVTSIYFLLTTYFMHRISELDPIIWETMALISGVVVILTIVTIFWKMSAHMTGVGGLVALVLVLGFRFSNFQSLYPLLLSIFLSGGVASSRLFLNAHKPLEVYVGFIFGFLSCYFGFQWIWS